MIQPYLYYCNIVWGCACPTLLSKLTNLQNRAVRLIAGAKYRSHVDPIYAQLRLTKLLDINKLQIAIFLYRAKNNFLPSSCMKYFDFVSTEQRHNTRTRVQFKMQAYRTNLKKNCICVSGPKLWNSLPVVLQESESLECFKKQFT